QEVSRPAVSHGFIIRLCAVDSTEEPQRSQRPRRRSTRRRSTPDRRRAIRFDGIFVRTLRSLRSSSVDALPIPGPVRLLASAHQQLDLVSLDLLFEDTETGLLADIEDLIEIALGLLDVCRGPRFEIVQHLEPISDQRFVHLLVAGLRQTSELLDGTKT